MVTGVLQTGQPPANTSVLIQPGMSVQAVVLTDASGTMPLYTSGGVFPVAAPAPTSPLVYPTGAQPPAVTGATFACTDYTTVLIDLTVTSVTGGGSVTFFLQRLGASGVFYPIWSTGTTGITSGTLSASIGPGMAGGDAATGQGGFGLALAPTMAFGWSPNGTVTSWQGSAIVTTR